MEVEVDKTPSDELFAELHGEFATTLERIAWAILRDWQLAADATQEAFLSLASKSAQIPLERRKAWLVRTVQLQAHNLRRKQQRSRHPGSRPKPSPSLGAGSGPADGSRSVPFTHPKFIDLDIANLARPQEVCPLEQAEESARLEQAIKSLPGEQQAIIRARLVEDQTFAQIAHKLQLPLGTVLSRMRLALGKLRRQLRNDEEENRHNDDSTTNHGA